MQSVVDSQGKNNTDKNVKEGLLGHFCIRAIYFYAGNACWIISMHKMGAYHRENILTKWIAWVKAQKGKWAGKQKKNS